MTPAQFIGARVRKLRLERRWTLEQLANRIDSNHGSLIRFERGERGAPMFDTLLKIALAFEITLSELVEGAEDQITVDSSHKALWRRLRRSA